MAKGIAARIYSVNEEKLKEAIEANVSDLHCPFCTNILTDIINPHLGYRWIYAVLQCNKCRLSWDISIDSKDGHIRLEQCSLYMSIASEVKT